MHKTKQSKTEKDKQNKTKQDLSEQIEEFNRLRHKHLKDSSKDVLI